MSWRGPLTALLLVAALVSGWSAWRQRAEVAVAGPVAARADYVLRDFELVSLGTDGKEAFTLRAPELARDPSDETMSLVTPLFLLPDRDGHYWEVRSQTGWVAADNSELRLRGAVNARTAEASPRRMTMDTEALDVFPETSIATSPLRVAITQPGITMSGTGMRANLADNRLQFHDQVTTRYEPARR